MVNHCIRVQGVHLDGATQHKPVLLQMNDDDFPKAFLQDLSVMPQPANGIASSITRSSITSQLSSSRVLRTAPHAPVTLYQPVARVTHIAMVELSCESPGYPRVDPRRVQSAGLVIRQVPQSGSSQLQSIWSMRARHEDAWPWMKNAQGRTDWMAPADPDADPDPTRRPQLQSGRADLDQLLAAQALSKALTESATPAFVAAPAICNAAGRTLVYAVIPTASSEASTLQPPSVGQLDPATIKQMLPTLLKAGRHHAPYANHAVDYRYMSDDYAKANKASDFLTFSATLRLLYTAFGAFQDDDAAKKLLQVLDKCAVFIDGEPSRPMGEFFQYAAGKLIDYDPNSDGPPVPEVKMPCRWEAISGPLESEILAAMAPLLQSQGNAAAAPLGRFQDSTRLYRARLFFRIKSENPGCPPQLVWSSYSDPFRIAAWYESSGRAVAPVPLPDPFDKNTLQSAKPTSSFAVPSSLMNAMNGVSLSGLSSGAAPAGGGGIGITWLCSFSIPLITICAFFVLNIFLSLLNIVFFWMAFIKICIPIPSKK